MHSGYLLNFALVIGWKEGGNWPHYNNVAPVLYRRMSGVCKAYDVLCRCTSIISPFGSQLALDNRASLTSLFLFFPF
jgi:hypothetical protein